MANPDLILAPTSPGWGAKCAHCRKWITKWDFTKDDALKVAEAAGHRCVVAHTEGEWPSRKKAT